MNLLVLLLPLFWGESFCQAHPGFDISVQEKATVQEGLCVSIHCTFQYPQEYNSSNPAFGYWFKGTEEKTPVATNDLRRTVQPRAQGRFHLIGEPQKDNCSLRITGVHKQDHGTYYFRVEKGNMKYSYKTKELSVHVEDLTQKPEISIPDILQSGHQVTLTCIVPGHCKQGTPPNILWTGSALSSQAFLSHDLNSSQLLFTPKAQDHGTNLTCQVTFQEPRVSTETTVQLRVAGRPRILGPSCSWTEEGSLCTCSVQGDLDPPSLHWWVGENIVHGNSSNNTLHVVHSTSRTWTNSSLILAKRLGTGLSISCEVKNHHGIYSASVLLLVPGKDSCSPCNVLEWMIKGALCGSIVTALLFTCLTVCLINMIKRKLSKRDLDAAPSGTRTERVSTANPLEAEDQVHYASISFKVQKPQEIPSPEDTHTEYSELKFQ